MVEGASTLLYRIANLRVSAHMAEVGAPTLWWRSVGSTHTAFSTETFLDQLADAAGIDPYAMRRKLLGKHPRRLGVIELAVEKAGWGQRLPKGRSRGIAVHESFKSYVAHVVEVTIGEDGLPKVERVVCAADCGIAINPDVIKAQLEGGMGFGLSAALFGSIELDDGRAVQSNFHDYRVLRASTRCRTSRCTSCPRVKTQRASGSRAYHRSHRRSPMHGPSSLGITCSRFRSRARQPRPEVRMRSTTITFGGALAIIGIGLAVSAATPQPAAGLKPVSDFASIVDERRRMIALFTEAGKVITSPRCLNSGAGRRLPFASAARRARGRKPAPGTQAEFGALIKAWADSGAACPAT
jgi:hypothetical protein